MVCYGTSSSYGIHAMSDSSCKVVRLIVNNIVNGVSFEIFETFLYIFKSF